MATRPAATAGHRELGARPLDLRARRRCAGTPCPPPGPPRRGRAATRRREARRDLLSAQYSLRGLDQRDDRHGAALHPLPPLQDRQVVVGAPHRFGGVGLGEDDPVQPRPHHGQEVVFQQPGVQRRSPARTAGVRLPRGSRWRWAASVARVRLLGGRHGVLDVEADDVGPRIRGARHEALHDGGDKEDAAQDRDAALLFVHTVRSQARVGLPAAVLANVRARARAP